MNNRGYACVGLRNPKNPLNVGAALRAAGCYNVKLLIIDGSRPTRYINRPPTDTQRQYRHMPVIMCSDMHTIIPFDCIPVAVEILDTAIPLNRYIHPERALYIFGAEDATLGKATLQWCRDIVCIPTTYCMNLAATVNVVLYDRWCKREAE